MFLAGACGGIAAPSMDAEPSPETPSLTAEGADASSRAASEKRSFDPRGYARSCAATSDCVLAPIINNCMTCCGVAPVNAAAVQADLAAAELACLQGRGECGMGCEKAHAECAEGQCIQCAERQCQDGVMVRAAITKVGTHVLEADIDGTTMGCTILLPGPSKITCAQGVEPVRGSNFDVEGVLFRTKSTGAITFRMSHDGALVGEKTFAPVYVAEPGPNGPQCTPKECIVARETFP